MHGNTILGIRYSPRDTNPGDRAQKIVSQLLIVLTMHHCSYTASAQYYLELSGLCIPGHMGHCLTSKDVPAGLSCLVHDFF